MGAAEETSWNALLGKPSSRCIHSPTEAWMREPRAIYHFTLLPFKRTLTHYYC